MTETHDALIERLRWREETFGFTTPKEFEDRRKELWLAADTRNHRTTPAGITREKRDHSDELLIEDDTSAILAELAVGRTIVGFHRATDSGEKWEQEANTVTLTLDDGSKLVFNGWGHDASGVHTYYAPSSKDSR